MLKSKWIVFWMICPYCSNRNDGDGGLLSALGSSKGRKKVVKSSVRTNTDQNTSLQMFFSATAMKGSRIWISVWSFFYLTCYRFCIFSLAEGFICLLLISALSWSSSPQCFSLQCLQLTPALDQIKILDAFIVSLGSMFCPKIVQRLSSHCISVVKEFWLGSC